MGHAAVQQHGSDAPAHGQGHGGGGHDHGEMYYVKIWAVLLVLLVISILGPMLGHKMLTIFTAFGIAIVKAMIVAAFFMHLNIEKRYIWYMLFGMLLMVVLFFFGIAADIKQISGRNWINRSAEQHIENHPMFAPHEDVPESGAAPAASSEPGAGQKEP